MADYSVPCSEILQGKLYLGNSVAAANKQLLLDLGVTHVLNMAHEIACFYPNNFKYKHVEIYDQPHVDIQKHFDACHEFIDDAKCIFVHCAQGRSRSASIVISYLIKRHSKTLKDAYIHVTTIRREVSPNNGFFKQLMQFEKDAIQQSTLCEQDLAIIELRQRFPKFSEEVITRIFKEKGCDLDSTIPVLFRKDLKGDYK